MADGWVVLNAGAGGPAIDEESITYGTSPTTRNRNRIVVTGTTAAGIADVVNTNVATNAYGLPTRAIAERSTAVSQAQVAQSASSVTLLAANTARRKWRIENYADTAKDLNLRLAAEVASATNLNITLRRYADTANGGIWSYEESGPGVYTGEIRGIWAGAGTGMAIVSEWT